MMDERAEQRPQPSEVGWRRITWWTCDAAPWLCQTSFEIPPPLPATGAFPGCADILFDVLDIDGAHFPRLLPAVGRSLLVAGALPNVEVGAASLTTGPWTNGSPATPEVCRSGKHPLRHRTVARLAGARSHGYWGSVCRETPSPTRLPSVFSLPLLPLVTVLCERNRRLDDNVPGSERPFNTGVLHLFDDPNAHIWSRVSQ
jgi:hypothetical protein